MKTSSSRGFLFPQRFVLAFMTFLGIAAEFMMRNVLSMAITQIARRTVSEEQIISGEKCPVDNSTLIDDGDKDFVEGSYEWSEAVQGVILSSFYWGYIITHIPGGMLVEKLGGKVTMIFAIASTSFLTLLTPASIYYGGSTLLIILRVIMGLCQGFIHASIFGLLSAWIPLRERTTLGAFVMSGISLGAILGSTLTGIILHNIEGWHWPFYFYSGAGAVWCILFAIFCSKDPQSNKFISISEKDYLAREIGSLQRDKNLPPPPFKAILTSLPVLALIISQMGNDFRFFVMAADLPKYFADVMGFNIRNNGLYSALPKVTSFVGALSFGFLSDYCINKKILSIRNTRRFFSSTAIIGSAVCFIMASYSGCSRFLAVFFFTLANAVNSIDNSKVNNMDLSPNYAPTISAIVNTCSAVMGILAPIAVGLLTPNSTITEWRSVFWLVFSISTGAGTFYLIFADGKIQPWNNPKNESVNDVEKEKKNELN